MGFVMRFRIGGAVYRVRLCNLGDRLGLCDYDNEILYLNPAGGVRHFAQTLAHEFSHAWVHQCPPPADMRGEDGADWCGALARSYHEQLFAQGGVDALHARAAAMGAVVQPDDCDVPVTPATGRQCSVCAGSIAPGDVRKSLHMHAVYGAVVRLEWDCEFCGETDVSDWIRTATGEASGVCVGFERRSNSGQMTVK